MTTEYRKKLYYKLDSIRNHDGLINEATANRLKKFNLHLLETTLPKNFKNAKLYQKAIDIIKNNPAQYEKMQLKDKLKWCAMRSHVRDDNITNANLRYILRQVFNYDLITATQDLTLVLATRVHPRYHETNHKKFYITLMEQLECTAMI